MFLSVITINKMSFADIFATISKMETVVVFPFWKQLLINNELPRISWQFNSLIRLISFFPTLSPAK